MEIPSPRSWTAPLPPGRPRIIAHRGAMSLAPQNTIAAFDLALDSGADALELDIQLSRDGVPVVFHDQRLDHLTDGSGRVEDHSVARLLSLDAGSHFGPRWRGAGIPTLEAVLDRYGHRSLLNLEIKSPALAREKAPLFESLPGTRRRIKGKEIRRWNDINLPMAEAVVSALRAWGAHRPGGGGLDGILVSSFDPVLLAMLKEALPSLALALLEGPLCRLGAKDLLPAHDLLARHPETSLCRGSYLAKEHRREHLVNCWTVNSPRKAIKFAKAGVAGLITNEPALLRQTFELLGTVRFADGAREASA